MNMFASSFPSYMCSGDYDQQALFIVCLQKTNRRSVAIFILDCAFSAENVADEDTFESLPESIAMPALVDLCVLRQSYKCR